MNGEEYAPCEVCGKEYSLPKYGVHLCAEHGTLKHAERIKND